MLTYYFINLLFSFLILHDFYHTAIFTTNMEYKQLGDSIHKAYERIAPHVFKTPLMHSPQLSKKYGCQVHLKLESEQKTGDITVCFY